MYAFACEAEGGSSSFLILSPAQVSSHVSELFVCWGSVPIAPMPEGQAGILVAVGFPPLALVTLEIRGWLLEQVAWGAWDRSKISWADQKAVMFFWQPQNSLSWFMNYIRSIYLAEEAHWGNRGWFVRVGMSMWPQRATSYQGMPLWIHYLQKLQSVLRNCCKGSPGDSQQNLPGYSRNSMNFSRPAF